MKQSDWLSLNFMDFHWSRVTRNTSIVHVIRVFTSNFSSVASVSISKCVEWTAHQGMNCNISFINAHINIKIREMN